MTPSETITSPSNPRIKQAASLRDADARRASGLTLVDGRRELARAAAAGIPIVEAFIDERRLHDTRSDAPEQLGDWAERLGAAGTRIAFVSERAFDRVAFGTRNEGIVGVVRFRPMPLAAVTFPADRPVLLIEGVEKPGNLGAILRTVDAAGLGGVIICDGRTDVANPAVIRASLGTVFAVRLGTASTTDVIDWCRQQGRRVVAATPEGSRMWHESNLLGSVAILLGSEAHGVSESWQAAAAAGTLALETIRLPMRGIADSLNLSVTTAILAYESVRQESTTP